MTLANTVLPARECPRFPGCSVNHCPLDPEQERHLVHIMEKQKVCPMEKGVRARIGSQYPALLPILGLTPSEAAGAARWAKLTSAEQEAKREAARGLSKRRHSQQPINEP